MLPEYIINAEKNMRVTVLTDNCAGKGAIRGEAGLSMLIETGTRNYLFDTGLSDLFVRNATLLDIELFGIDRIVISHGHYDHADGLPWALAASPRAELTIHRLACRNKFSKSTGVLRYIGPGVKTLHAIELAEEEERLTTVNRNILRDGDNIVFSTGGRKKLPDGWKFFVEDKFGRDLPDRFPDEISLLIPSGQGSALFVGCAHCGLPAIVQTAEKLVRTPITHIFGGSHLDQATDREIGETADFFRERHCELFLGHCTGVNGYARLYRALGGRRLTPLQSGFIFQF